MELLATTNRSGARCTALCDVHDTSGEFASYLVCNLKKSHPGPLHYDSADGIWWSTDTED